MRVLLHICCGICAAGTAERLISEGHEVTGYFYNPHIHPAEEYQRRLDVAHKVSDELHFQLINGPYVPEEWFREASDLANEPEGGKRCEVCFQHRLRKTFSYLKECGVEVFTTTLTISPHKRAEVINRIGQEIGGDKFLARDFKKKAGFQRANELARKWSLYHQNYCGCIYSQRASQ